MLTGESVAVAMRKGLHTLMRVTLNLSTVHVFLPIMRMLALFIVMWDHRAHCMAWRREKVKGGMM